MQLPINSNLIIVPLNQLFNAGPTLMDQCMIIFPERTQVCRVRVSLQCYSTDHEKFCRGQPEIKPFTSGREYAKNMKRKITINVS